MGFLGRKNKKKYEQAARLLADGEIEEAIAMLRAIIEEDPTHTHALTSLAVALMETQDEPDWDHPDTIEAMHLLDRAEKSNPKDVIPVFNKAVILRNLGRLEEALETFEAALQIEERLPLAILHMAEINYELGRWEKAVELARLALIRDPGIEGALTWVPDAMKKAGYLDEEGKVIKEKVPWPTDQTDRGPKF